MNDNLCNKLTKLDLNRESKYMRRGVSVSSCITYFVNNSDEIQQYKDNFRLNRCEFYELQFSKDFIEFLNYLRKLDAGLTGFWFTYFFKYCLGFPNYSDHRIIALKNELSRQNVNNENEVSLIDQINLNPADKEELIEKFLFAFEKNQRRERLTVQELFDIALAHPIYKNRGIENAVQFRERLRECGPEFVEEVEQFKTIWKGIEINLEYTYEDCLIGHPRLKIENEIFEFKVVYYKPEDFTIFRALTFAFMSPERMDFINVLQPLTNKIFTWDIRHITQESREKFLKMLTNNYI